MSREVMQQALDAMLALPAASWAPETAERNYAAITALREALAQSPQREAIKQAVEAEREACAKVCEKMADAHGWEGGYATECVEAIRARGQA